MSAKPTKSADAADQTTAMSHEPTHDEIALCAMSIWIEEGRPEGRDLDHWLRAEAWLRQASRNQSQVQSRPASRSRSRNKSRAAAVAV